MEKKSKKGIVIALTSLVLITLILLGLTYAYYRTRIIGNNSNEPSISVQSKKMEVTYEDGTSEMNMTGLIEPGFTASKTFYVENIGDQSVSYSIMIEDMNNTYERNQDWTYTLTENETKISEGILAVGRHQVLSGSRSIDATNGTKNTYVLTINYVNSDEDQNEDMGESLSFKVNIGEEQYTWDDAPSGSLLYTLRKNQPIGTKTTIPEKESSTANEARILTIEDDYGTSYVYRGNVQNNYVNYSGMCWRVVRVQGDGTIKLALADEKGECNATTYSTDNKTTAFINDGSHYFYSNSYNIDGLLYENGNIPEELTTWMNKEITDTEGTVTRSTNLDTSKLVTTEWCNDLSITWTYSFGYNDNWEDVFEEKEATNGWYTDLKYGAHERLWDKTTASPSLKCNFKGMNDSKAIRYESNIGILTADEIAFAGGVNNTANSTNYLYTNANGNYYWTMSPVLYSQVFGGPMVFFKALNGLNFGTVYSDSFTVRPAVVLKSNVTIETGGLGTQTNPYNII